MKIVFANKRQCEIADLMWEAQDNDEIQQIIKKFGDDAIIVYTMMMASYYDQINDTNIALEILNNIFHKK